MPFFWRSSAPEYALDEILDPASDMYSLGCLMYAVHCKGNPPFKNHGNLGGLRENAGKPLKGMDRLDQDLRGVSKPLPSVPLSDSLILNRTIELIDHTTPSK